MCKLVQGRIERFGEIEEKLSFLTNFGAFDSELYFNKKQKADADVARQVLPAVEAKLATVTTWDNATLYQTLVDLAAELGIKNGQVLWPTRIALTGLAATPGGASEVAEILGKDETLRRLGLSIQMLNN